MDAAETSANAAKARLERMASVAATATRVVSIEPMLAQVVASAWVAETCTDPAAVAAIEGAGRRRRRRRDVAASRHAGGGVRGG